MKPVHLVNGALYGGLLAGSLVLWPRLPARIPAHFDAFGDPTRWTEADAGAWFLPVAVALLCVILFYGLAVLVRGRPQLINIPRRDELLRLPAERRGPVLDVFTSTLHACAVPIGLLFCGIQYWIWFTALDGVPPASGVGVFLGVFTLGLIPGVLGLAMLVRMNGVLDRALRSD